MSDDIARFPRHPRKKGATPSRVYACPSCAIKFLAKNSTDEKGRVGKVCPNGHWHTTSRLHKYTTTGSIRSRATKEAVPVRNAGNDAQLRVCLRMLLDSYDQMERTLPKRTIAHGMATAPFKGIVGLAREVLEGVS